MRYRAQRYQTQFPINVRTHCGNQQAEVLDVNHDGARLAGLTRLKHGEKIELDVLSRRVSAIVRWTTLNRVGVVFRPKLGDHQVDTLRQRCDRRSTPQHGRGQFGFAEMH